MLIIILGFFSAEGLINIVFKENGLTDFIEFTKDNPKTQKDKELIVD